MRRLYGIGVLLAGATWAWADLTLLSTFNPGGSASINSIGFNESTDEVFVHFNHNWSVHVYARSGSYLRSFTKPSGVAGNDDDLELATEPVNVGGTIVPAHSLLIVENDNDPPRIVAARATDGAFLAQQAFNTSLNGNWTGGAYHHERDTFFCTDWSLNAVQEVDAGTGAVVQQFTIAPEGVPYFYLYYSDVDVLRASGHLYVVSNGQDFIRVMSPSGQWVVDMDVSGLGIDGMAGIAIDDGRGEAWICGQNGVVYQVGGLEPFQGGPCSPADFAQPFGVLNFFDVQAFLQAFSAHATSADMNSDGVHNFFDMQTFLSLFSAGCP